jgi:hypothetical protein
VSLLVLQSANESRGCNLPDRLISIRVHVELSFPARSATSFATSGRDRCARCKAMMSYEPPFTTGEGAYDGAADR